MFTGIFVYARNAAATMHPPHGKISVLDSAQQVEVLRYVSELSSIAGLRGNFRAPAPVRQPTSTLRYQSRLSTAQNGDSGPATEIFLKI
jgi:hypothetical protein